jgi:hypothetical protein
MERECGKANYSVAFAGSLEGQQMRKDVLRTISQFSQEEGLCDTD